MGEQGRMGNYVIRKINRPDHRVFWPDKEVRFYFKCDGKLLKNFKYRKILFTFKNHSVKNEGFSGSSAVKKEPVMQELQEMQIRFLCWEDPMRRAWQPTPVFLPGQSSLAGCSPWGPKESDITKAT